MCNHRQIYSFTCDMHVYILVLPIVFDAHVCKMLIRKCLVTWYYELFSHLDLVKQDLDGGIRHYTLLDSILDFAWGILALSVHNSRTDSPSTLRSTCLRNPSPCLLFHWSIVCRYPHQKLSWGQCPYSWLSYSYKYYSDTVGLRRLFPHKWGSAGTLVSVPVFLEVKTQCSNVGFIFARPWRRMHSHAALLQSRTQTCLHYRFTPCVFPLQY